MAEENKPRRKDPYKSYKFRIKWDNKTVLGVSKVSTLKRTTEVVSYRSGGDNSTDHKSPGRTSYEGITCERGITLDLEFEAWANKVHPYEGDTAMDLADYKKHLTLEMMNEKGQVVLRYFLYDCWVSEFTALPDLDASTNAVAIESIKIELEGWKRDPFKIPKESDAVPQEA
ncbi:MAG: phage tail protein [Desulfobulbaceae bacterium A2]|nr:MAG: phage tail protein [Desulfobulbaceae bacterium A2]